MLRRCCLEWLRTVDYGSWSLVVYANPSEREAQPVIRRDRTKDRVALRGLEREKEIGISRDREAPRNSLSKIHEICRALFHVSINRPNCKYCRYDICIRVPCPPTGSNFSAGQIRPLSLTNFGSVVLPKLHINGPESKTNKYIIHVFTLFPDSPAMSLSTRRPSAQVLHNFVKNRNDSLLAANSSLPLLAPTTKV